MAFIERHQCRVDVDGITRADSVELELWCDHKSDPRYPEVNAETPWLGKIFDPPESDVIREGQACTIVRIDGAKAECRLLKIAKHLPGADVHYVPENVTPGKVWVFLGAEPFTR